MSNNRIDISKNDVFDYEAKLIYITYSKFENDWTSLMHFHPFSEIFYVVGGKGKFTVENDTFDVKQDDMIIVNPNVYHHEDSDGDHPLEYVVLGVENLSFGLNGEDNEFLYQSFEKNNDDIQYYITHLLTESEEKLTGYETVCQKLFDLFLLKVVRYMKLNLSDNPIQKPMKREIRMICQYIDQNYAEDMSLESLAEFMKMNKYYMAHEFKNNIVNALNRYRNLWNAEHNKLGHIQVDIPLQPDEVCHAAAQVGLCQHKVVEKEDNYFELTRKFNIDETVTFKGEKLEHPKTKEEITALLDIGNFLLTNQRIIYLSRKTAQAVDLDKITAAELDVNIITFHTKDNGDFMYKFSDDAAGVMYILFQRTMQENIK